MERRGYCFPYLLTTTSETVDLSSILGGIQNKVVYKNWASHCCGTYKLTASSSSEISGMSSTDYTYTPHNGSQEKS